MARLKERLRTPEFRAALDALPSKKVADEESFVAALRRWIALLPAMRADVAIPRYRREKLNLWFRVSVAPSSLLSAPARIVTRQLTCLLLQGRRTDNHVQSCLLRGREKKSRVGVGGREDDVWVRVCAPRGRPGHRVLAWGHASFFSTLRGCPPSPTSGLRRYHLPNSECRHVWVLID
jgi:hypothetical protein